jgi:hypothetical protein
MAAPASVPSWTEKGVNSGKQRGNLSDLLGFVVAGVWLCVGRQAWCTWCVSRACVYVQTW